MNYAFSKRKDDLIHGIGPQENAVLPCYARRQRLV
jgi:hypothetical protein